ncbi:MAG: GNAT family N-acetyltransferase [Deltaproteobacteria bacterium]|nr:GNAT family N-acetyltransferase [Deltaproteobacteria bacterium]
MGESPRHFTADYVERVTLRDGTRVVLRLLVPEDKALLEAGFARWSPESRYARFLTSKTTLSADELRYLTEVDQEDHFALGALHEARDGTLPVGLGIARFIRLPELHATAEAAIAVADEVQGRGLGKLLFLRLCAAAAERGLERFRCEVLGSNTGMAALIETIAPERTIEVGGGVMSIEMALPNVTPTEPPETIAQEGSMYRMLKAAAQNTIEWTSDALRLWRRND